MSPKTQTKAKSKTKSRTAGKKAVKKVPSIRKEFGGLVELIQGEFPAPFYEKFFGPFRGRKPSTSRPDIPPPPEGVIEHTSAEYEPITDGGIVELADGTLMLAHGDGINESVGRTTCRISKDGGATWSKAKAFRCGMGVAGMIRLQSGALAIYGKETRKGEKFYFSSSKDDGRTWAKPSELPVYWDFHPLFHSMTQLSSGRLLLAGYCGSGPEDLGSAPEDLQRLTSSGWGWWRGVRLGVEGHRSPGGMGRCKTFHSDDEGRTWKGCRGGLMGWFSERGVPDGTGGLTSICEPTVAETNDGRLLMFSRCRRGRLAQCYSLDAGDTWLSVQPTNLSSSQSPPMLVRIPQTGDLLCVWNHVSADEIRHGEHRCRLSSAISKDSGRSWCHFKTIESCEGMADVDQIVPEFPIPWGLRGNPGLGQLADGYANFDYPNVDIIGDKVFLRYSRGWPVLGNDDKAEMTGEGILRIYPLEWFYR